MPGGDGTGPMGMGPMTGRAAGYCAGYPMPGSMSPVAGRGFWGMGRGMRGGGRGRRNWFYATGIPGYARAAQGIPAWGARPFVPPVMPTPAYGMPPAGYGAPAMGLWPQMGQEQQLDALKGQAEYFEDMLDGIKKRIEELEAQQAESAPKT